MKNSTILNHPTFCVLPFVHLYQSPGNIVSGCCISHPGKTVNSGNLEEKINAPHMKSLRKRLLAGEMPNVCKSCWNIESAGHLSPRRSFNEEWVRNYKEDIEYAIPRTDPNTGHIHNFVMRYADVRFNNVCNFKCRTCSSSFSSLWVAENKKHNTPDWIGGGEVGAGTEEQQEQTLQSILDNITTIRKIYFAGGEPLVQEKNYTILQALIDNNRFDCHLMFSTNGSVTKFKDYDLIDMLSKFKKVTFSVSLDDIEERAEYIRHGTDWEEQLKNLQQFSLLSRQSNFEYVLSATISAFNFMSFPQAVYKLWEQGAIIKGTALGLTMVQEPAWLSARVLPEDKKLEKSKDWDRLANFCNKNNISLTNEEIQRCVTWATRANTYEDYIMKFQEHTRYIDNIRDENFSSVFPELEYMT